MTALRALASLTLLAIGALLVAAQVVRVEAAIEAVAG